MMMKLKTVTKELLPPIVLKLIKSFRNSQPIKYENGSEQTYEYYENKSRELDSWRIHYSKSEYYPLWSVIVDRIQRVDTKSLLEIGCGSGQLAALIRDKGITKYIGLDFSPNLIALARKACPEFDFVIANALETDLFYTHDYDTVVTTEFLEHVERDIEVIENIRKGTRFYGSVPNFPWISHVRYFNSVQEVYDRYAQYFDSFRVDTLLSIHNNSTVYYLLEGVKS
ncbi:class I SAM-dependent methyltransferase [Nostoc sp. CHAB 5784]|uniref:class I SAM-dependent methyltransferase n=1 Tax=Nostoc mirabile TaxID=2907820 RepID=UPI001E4526DE|nr:class I SAM-dependent methyltransferase [Nostoc mirabile]MCC5669059.1 class I SAM-dependent methyltransferase [Nostoc mirabile CHAB5784]